MYQKSILLTQDRRLEQFIKVLMRTKKKELETDLPLLYDLNALRSDIQKCCNTLHLRGEFGSFIKNFGFPYMIVMDYIIDFGLSKGVDPDMRKLLRTFLIAFTILANGKGFDSATSNIVLIIEKKYLRTVLEFVRDPALLLEQIKTQDARVNAIIESFAQDSDRVKGFFNLSYIFRPDEGNYNKEMENLERIIDASDNLLKKKELKKGSSAVSEMITEDVEPARVICRATIDRIIKNGGVHEISDDEREQYKEKDITLIGAITVKTIKTVNDRIVETFKAMNKINPFKKDERIFINIPDISLIDGSFASSMGSFLNSELGLYKGVSLNMGKNNSMKVKDSPGYIGIKDYIIKNL
ncbi:MAG: hypothetical protein JSV25_05890 [Spirochaetota bacterium]|nr:MAG: hypothetical protein JSV25_05890 [Spirochaetota bacterium]